LRLQKDTEELKQAAMESLQQMTSDVKNKSKMTMAKYFVEDLANSNSAINKM
jgi:hypothetical protein